MKRISVPRPSNALIQAALRLDGTAREAISQALTLPIDWSEFIQMAINHGVLPLISARLTAYARDRIPAEVLELINAHCQQHEIRVMSLMADTLRVVHLLENAGIPTIILKGFVLADELYGDPTLRNFSDIDLLVPEAHLITAHRVLEQAGLHCRDFDEFPSDDVLTEKMHEECEWHYNFPHRCDMLELHWRLTPIKHDPVVSTGHLFQRSRTRTLAQHEVRIIDSMDLCLYLAVHGAKHFWNRWRYLIDFATAMQNITQENFARLLQHAGQYRRRRVLLTSIALAQQLLGLSLPSGCIGRDLKTKPITMLVQSARTALLRDSTIIPQDQLSGIYHRILSNDVPISTLRWILHLAFHPTETDHRWFPLPQRLQWAYPCLRPIRLSGKLVSHSIQMWQRTHC